MPSMIAVHALQAPVTGISSGQTETGIKKIYFHELNDQIQKHPTGQQEQKMPHQATGLIPA